MGWNRYGTGDECDRLAPDKFLKSESCEVRTVRFNLKGNKMLLINHGLGLSCIWKVHLATGLDPTEEERKRNNLP